MNFLSLKNREQYFRLLSATTLTTSRIKNNCGMVIGQFIISYSVFIAPDKRHIDVYIFLISWIPQKTLRVLIIQIYVFMEKLENITDILLKKVIYLFHLHNFVETCLIGIMIIR